MQSNLTPLIATAREHELRGHSGRRAAARLQERVVLRPATASDRAGLERLAALDGSEPLHGPVLLAEVDDVLAAALPFRGGRAIADPFRPTAHLVALLRQHADVLKGASIWSRAMHRGFQRAA